MKRSGLVMILAVMVTSACGTALAATPKARQAIAVPVPIGSPGDWLSPADYPPAALRHDMEGITAFVLTVNAQGTATDCRVTNSSGFDVLDEAACERLIKNARFVPAGVGQPTLRRWSSRVRWVLPNTVEPFHDFAQTIRFEIDPTGKRLSCRRIEGGAKDEDDPCRFSDEIGPVFGLAMRGSSPEPTVEVLIETSGALGAGPPAVRTGPVAGYEVRALHVFSFEIASGGKMSGCRLTQQRGPSVLITDFCRAYDHWTFDVPFTQMAADGSVKGWAVTRILVRTAG